MKHSYIDVTEQIYLFFHIDKIVSLSEKFNIAIRNDEITDEIYNDTTKILDDIESELSIKKDRDVHNLFRVACVLQNKENSMELYFILMDPIVQEIKDRGKMHDVALEVRRYERVKECILSKSDYSRFTKLNGDFFIGMETFNNDISKWDTSRVTDMKNYFGNVPEYTSNGTDEIISKPILSFEEEKLLRERELLKWKDTYLNEHIKFLEFTWSLSEDSIAHVRIRLELFSNSEFYHTGIVDSIGMLHKRVRIRELQALYDRLVSEREIRERKVEGKWKLIQSATKISELPLISVEKETLTPPEITVSISDVTKTVMENRSYRETRPLVVNPSIVKKPMKPIGPRFRNTLM